MSEKPRSRATVFRVSTTRICTSLHSSVKVLRLNTFTDLWKLVQILLVLPLNTAACKRGQLLLNIVKTYRRNRLSEELLDHLMVVSLHAKFIKSEEDEARLISAASKLWYSKRRNGTLLEMCYVICICVCAATHSILRIIILLCVGGEPLWLAHSAT